jgi:hypothetical protein
MEVIKEALIIEANGLKVNAFIVENLPKKFIYQKAKKMMPLDEYSERLVPAFYKNERGEKVQTGELVDELQPGIESDGAGSGGFIFMIGSDDSMVRLREIDKHIEELIKDPALRYKREPYAAQPGSPSSNPKPYNQIIRVRLPSPASPPNVPTLEQAGALSARPKKVKTPEQIAAMRARLEKARAARAAKAAEKPIQ